MGRRAAGVPPLRLPALLPRHDDPRTAPHPRPPLPPSGLRRNPSCLRGTQGSILIQRVGAKVVLTANMLCTSAILFTLPFLTSIYPMFSLLAIMGLLQVSASAGTAGTVFYG